MKLIVGLGNPGEKYKNTRHNLGFSVVDAVAGELGIENYELSKKGKAEYAWAKIGQEDTELFKPQTFMNDSGFSVFNAKKNHSGLENSDICVIHDDLDLVFGSFKLQFGKGPHQHNGITSIENHLGTKDFWRLRVGVENRSKNSEVRIKGEDYVLAKFTTEELKSLNLLIEKELIPAIQKWVANHSL